MIIRHRAPEPESPARWGAVIAAILYLAFAMVAAAAQPHAPNRPPPPPEIIGGTPYADAFLAVEPPYALRYLERVSLD